MRLAGFVWAGVAVFAGVLGALQADAILEGTRPPTPVPQTASEAVPEETRPNVTPVQNAPVGTSAPFDFRAAAKRVNPSVVSVDRYNRYQRSFFDDEGVEAESGTGSGVILSSDGIIVTNNHVVARADRVRVRTRDGKGFDARVLGTDPVSDLAVLKVNAKNLPPVEVGDSGRVEVGQWVMAVGNPLGFDNTVSVGVVSSLKRSLPISRSQGLVDAIQTDAAINPGNSGGALTDAQGRLIGINSAIASSNGGSVGIGFAIPMSQVRRSVDDILKLGYVRYAGLGISFDRRYDGALASPDFRNQVAEVTGVENVPSQGVLIGSVQGDAARTAGLRGGDVLLAIDGTEIKTSFDLNRALVPRKPGETVKVRFWSRGKAMEASVRLSEITR